MSNCTQDPTGTGSYISYVFLRELNPYITCSMCAGYFIDATTITECHHRFCKSCIVQHLETNSTCPECEISLNESDPFSCLKFDRNIQDLVYKLVPGLQACEKQLRNDFNVSRSKETPNQQKTPLTLTEPLQPYLLSLDEKVSLEIHPHSSLSNFKDANLKKMPYRYIRCSVRTMVYHLQRFIHCRVQVPLAYELELLCNETMLEKDTSLKDVYLETWAPVKKEFPVILYYTIRRLP